MDRRDAPVLYGISRCVLVCRCVSEDGHGWVSVCVVVWVGCGLVRDVGAMDVSSTPLQWPLKAMAS